MGAWPANTSATVASPPLPHRHAGDGRSEFFPDAHLHSSNAEGALGVIAID
jgi:hypothetical protein